MKKGSLVQMIYVSELDAYLTIIEGIKRKLKSATSDQIVFLQGEILGVINTFQKFRTEFPDIEIEMSKEDKDTALSILKEADLEYYENAIYGVLHYRDLLIPVIIDDQGQQYFAVYNKKSISTGAYVFIDDAIQQIVNYIDYEIDVKNLLKDSLIC